MSHVVRENTHPGVNIVTPMGCEHNPSIMEEVTVQIDPNKCLGINSLKISNPDMNPRSYLHRLKSTIIMKRSATFGMKIYDN